MYWSRALPDWTLPFQRAESICRRSMNGRYLSFSTAVRTWVTTSGLACPITTDFPSTTDSPKNSASPSLSHGGRSLPKNAWANWWKPSCWITCPTRCLGSFSTQNARPAPRGPMKNMPPEPVPLMPKLVRSVSR
jgi:hypothetical protein